MGSQEGITSHVWAHLTIAQDEVGEDREHGAARGALEPPDGEPTEPDTHIMRVAGQAGTGSVSCNSAFILHLCCFLHQEDFMEREAMVQNP